MRHYDKHVHTSEKEYKGLSLEDKNWLNAFNKATISADFSELQSLPISTPALATLKKEIHKERHRRRNDFMNNGKTEIEKKDREPRKKCRCYQISDYTPTPAASSLEDTLVDLYDSDLGGAA